MTHKEQNVEQHHEGDHVELHITVTAEDGTVKDLTGASAEWLLMESESDADADAVLTKSGTEGGTGEISFTDPVNGELMVEITTSETEGLVTWSEFPDNAKEFHHRVRVTDADGKRVTGFTGMFEVLP